MMDVVKRRVILSPILLLALTLMAPACSEEEQSEAAVPSALPPTQFTSREGDIWQPKPGTSWQWQLVGAVDTSIDVEMYDVDLFDVPKETIEQLHEEQRVVICYFSAGSWEDWRVDAAAFPKEIIGKDLSGWPGEKWLDIRRLELVGPIMAARLNLAAEKGCDGVEPDNIAAYDNDTGFSISFQDQLDYNRWLSEEAHSRRLSIGLKNDLGQIEALVSEFDWALNEECFQYDECEALIPFVREGKAVFGVEYEGESDSFCPRANALNFDWLKKRLDLDAWRVSCR